jgi:hypothetical protein
MDLSSVLSNAAATLSIWSYFPTPKNRFLPKTHDLLFIKYKISIIPTKTMEQPKKLVAKQGVQGAWGEKVSGV